MELKWRPLKDGSDSTMADDFFIGMETALGRRLPCKNTDSEGRCRVKEKEKQKWRQRWELGFKMLRNAQAPGVGGAQEGPTDGS